MYTAEQRCIPHVQFKLVHVDITVVMIHVVQLLYTCTSILIYICDSQP